jgi:hypothetical protein
MTAKTAKNSTETAPDLSVILPDRVEIEIAGVKCHVRHLKMREFFRVMGIVTNGIGPAVTQIRWNDAEDPEQMGAIMLSAFIMALPNQADEFIVLMRDMIEPVGGPEEMRKVHAHLLNPEVDDLFPVIDAIITNERENVYQLLGKARAYFTKWGTELRPAMMSG